MFLHDDDLLKAHQDEQAKRLNAANDETTRELLPLFQQHFDGCQIANGRITLRAEVLYQPRFDVTVVKSQHARFNPTDPPPLWLIPSDVEPKFLFAIVYLPIGKYHLQVKQPQGKLDFHCDTTGDLISTMKHHLAKL